MNEATCSRLVFEYSAAMPKSITVRNKSRSHSEVSHVKYCDTFLSQLRGLTFRSGISREEGLLLVGKRDSRLDSSIHMVFVPFNLTVVWISSSMQVVDKILAKRWRPAYFSKQPAKYVLEIHPERWGDFEIGDGVEFKDA